MKLIVDWDSYNTAVEQLVERLRLACITPGAVMGIPRGGLVAAVMLSHRLSIPLVPFRKDLVNPDVLLVDDICDTGGTLSKIVTPQEDNPNVRPLAVGVVVCKPKGYFYLDSLQHGVRPIPTFFGMAAATEYWVVFPYEDMETEGAPNGTVA